MDPSDALEHHHETSLESLPDDLIRPILARSGCISIVKATSISKRLQAIHNSFRSITCFSAGSSTAASLEQAVKESAARAMEGMLGHVTWAVIFTCNHVGRKKVSPASMLSQFLPSGTPIVGAASTGLMGVDKEGKPFEIAPASTREPGMSVLLGHMPGAICRVFCDCSKPSDPIHFSLEQWTGLDREENALVPVSCWLFIQGGRSVGIVPSSLVQWLRRPELNGPTIAGGLGSGALDFHPGKQEGQDRVTGWYPEAGAQGARYAGLMILREKNPSEILPLPPPRSTVLAINGYGPISSASVWAGFKELAIEHVQTDGGEELVLVTSLQTSCIRRLDNARGTALGFHDQLLEEAHKYHSHGHPKVCLWSSDGRNSDPKSMLAAIRSGLGAIGELHDQEDVIALFDAVDSATLQHILKQGHDQLRYTLMWLHEGGVRGVLGTELVASIKSVTCPSNDLNQELLAIAASNARAAGAKGGSSTAICLFSCTGRGKSLISSEDGKVEDISEASIADSCCDEKVPIIGCFLHGELGPQIKAGYVGWSSSESASALPRNFESDADMQGFTTMYACIGG